MGFEINPGWFSQKDSLHMYSKCKVSGRSFNLQLNKSPKERNKILPSEIFADPASYFTLISHPTYYSLRCM